MKLGKVSSGNYIIKKQSYAIGERFEAAIASRLAPTRPFRAVFLSIRVDAKDVRATSEQILTGQWALTRKTGSKVV